MISASDLWIVIPAYNEAKIIRDVVADLVLAGYPNVCVVDDGSIDDTASRGLEGGASVLRHILNLGQGAALQTGIDYALARGAKYVCTYDADGQHSPDSVTMLCAALSNEGAEVALGSRFLSQANEIPMWRRLLLKAALIFTRIHARVNVTDTHNGLRLLTCKAALALRIEQPQMAHASEILQKLGDARLPFVEVPVKIQYTEYSKAKGQSGFDSVKILLDLLYRSIALRR